MNQLIKLGITVLLFSAASMFATHDENSDINAKSHRIDYGYAKQLAYKLADLAEAMSYGSMAITSEGDVGIKSHRDIQYRAEALHQAASNLYYLLQGYRGFSVGTLDHRDSLDGAFWSVSNAYNNLNAVAYGYSMQRISNVYYQLASSLGY